METNTDNTAPVAAKRSAAARKAAAVRQHNAAADPLISEKTIFAEACETGDSSYRAVLQCLEPADKVTKKHRRQYRKSRVDWATAFVSRLPRNTAIGLTAAQQHYLPKYFTQLDPLSDYGPYVPCESRWADGKHKHSGRVALLDGTEIDMVDAVVVLVESGISFVAVG